MHRSRAAEMPLRNQQQRSSHGLRNLLALVVAVSLAWCCSSLLWVLPSLQSTQPSIKRHARNVGQSSRVVRQARGGEFTTPEEFRAYAASLPVPPGYAGPHYQGPGSVNDAFVQGLLAMYAQQQTLPMKYAYLMTLDVLDLLKQERSLQTVAVPPGSKVTVVGDIHGQFFDFKHMLEQVTGLPSAANPILFNGDFVDRGVWSVEVLMCLYAFKLQNPTSVHFNRGNHETEMTNYQYGFAGEVTVKYEEKLMYLFSETFRYLPLATVLENQVLVTHAGIPGPENRLWEDWFQKAPDEAAGVLKRDKQVTLAEIAAVNRAVEPNPFDNPMVIDFLWSDPKGANGYGPSTRVPSVYTWGPDVAANFLAANNLRYMIRSHETKSSGWQETVPNVFTVFSAPNYIDAAGNMAAVAVLTNQGGSLEKQFITFQHQPHPPIPTGAYMPGKSLAPPATR